MRWTVGQTDRQLMLTALFHVRDGHNPPPLTLHWQLGPLVLLNHPMSVPTLTWREMTLPGLFVLQPYVN